MRLLIPQQYIRTSGLAGSIQRFVETRGFTDDEFEQCRLAGEICVNIVLAFAINKLMQMENLGVI